MREAAAVHHRVRYVGAAHHRAQRDVAGAQALGERQDVDLGADLYRAGCAESVGRCRGRRLRPGRLPMLIRAELTGAADAGHDLVVDDEHAVPAADLRDGRQVARRRHQSARGGATHRLDDERRHRVRSLLQDLALQLGGTLQTPLLLAHAGGAGMARGCRYADRTQMHGGEGLVQWRVARGLQGAEGGAVIRGEAADDLVAARLAVGQVVLPRQFDGRLNGFRTARHVEHAPQVLAQLRGQRTCQLVRGLVLELCAVGEGDALCLVPHGLQDPLVAVSDGGRDGPGGAVEVALALGVVQPDARGVADGRQFQMPLVEEQISLPALPGRCSWRPGRRWIGWGHGERTAPSGVGPVTT